MSRISILPPSRPVTFTASSARVSPASALHISGGTDEIRFSSLEKLEQRSLNSRRGALLKREIFPAIPGVCDAFSGRDLLVALGQFRGTLRELQEKYDLDEKALSNGVIALRDAGLLSQGSNWDDTFRPTPEAEQLLAKTPAPSAPDTDEQGVL